MFNCSAIIKQEKAIVEIFKEILFGSSNSFNVPIIITEAWNKDINTQNRKDFTVNSLPFCNSLYNDGNFNTLFLLVSLSYINEITGKFVYIDVYPNTIIPLNIGIGR